MFAGLAKRAVIVFPGWPHSLLAGKQSEELSGNFCDRVFSFFAPFLSRSHFLFSPSPPLEKNYVSFSNSSLGFKFQPAFCR